MKRAMFLPLCVSAILMATPTIAKQKTYSWIKGMCDVTIRYDDAKVKERPLFDTIYLLTQAYDALGGGRTYVSTPEDIKRLNRDELLSQCKDRKEKLSGLELLQIPSLKGKLEPLRQDLLKLQTAVCNHEDVQLRGYSDASALREYKAAPQCDHFIDALENEEKLESTWRQFTNTLCADNASFEDCRQSELKKAALPDAKVHMRITLIAFGWNNCVIPSVWRNSEALRAKLESASNKLEAHFKAKTTCEEP